MVLEDGQDTLLFFIFACEESREPGFLGRTGNSDLGIFRFGFDYGLFCVFYFVLLDLFDDFDFFVAIIPPLILLLLL